MMRRPEWPCRCEPIGRFAIADRPDSGDLECFVGVEGREDGFQSPGQHGLAAAGGPGGGQGMAARGGDFGRGPAGGGADDRASHARFPAPDGRLRGEATPIYLYWPNSLERIATYNPAMKLIVLLREPVSRAWSHWKILSKR